MVINNASRALFDDNLLAVDDVRSGLQVLQSLQSCSDKLAVNSVDVVRRGLDYILDRLDVGVIAVAIVASDSPSENTAATAYT